MNNIYKCAMIQSQINSLQKIRKVLIKDSVALQSRLDKKIELKENRLKLIANQIGKEEDILKEDVEKIQKDINRLEKLTEKKEDKIDDNEKIIEKTFKRVNKCIRDNNESKITKKDVLRATTKELCKYHSYLEYLREHNSDLSNLIDKT
jgi:chromosome segregation ATPase